MSGKAVYIIVNRTIGIPVLAYEDHDDARRAEAGIARSDPEMLFQTFRLHLAAPGAFFEPEPKLSTLERVRQALGQRVGKLLAR